VNNIMNATVCATAFCFLTNKVSRFSLKQSKYDNKLVTLERYL
jgi:hypothetical protein